VFSFTEIMGLPELKVRCKQIELITFIKFHSVVSTDVSN
jgi:hypothetical protein